MFKSLFNSSEIMEEKSIEKIKKVIVDVDAGTDDYLALLLLLHAEKMGEIKIECIFCSMGNTSTENVVKNVLRLLETVRRTDIPIYKGAEKQIILPKESINQFHGKDGFGDLNHDKDPNLSLVTDVPASIVLHNIVNNNPNEIHLICVGPLTNLALALKLYGDLCSKIKEVWIMGGNFTAVGNVTSAAEYNFYIDPEAAYITLECLKCPIYILPWEPCLMTDITFDWRYNVLGDRTPALNLLTRAEKKIYVDNFENWLPCDAFLVFCFLNPENIIKQSKHHATIELYSSYTRGQVVLDHLKNKQPNVTIIEKFDSELFKEFLVRATSAE